MSHTLHWDDGDQGQPVFFHYNGDFSGYVTIGRPQYVGQPGWRVEVPADALRYFLAEYIRAQAIQEIEHIADEDLIRRGVS